MHREALSHHIVGTNIAETSPDHVRELGYALRA